MEKNRKNTSFFEELKTLLPNSTGSQRAEWASRIVNENMSIRQLSDLLLLEDKIASRFLWLLSDVGRLDAKALGDELVFLYDRCRKLDHIRSEASFANYWLICGVPEKKEGTYITDLFDWLNSPTTNVTTKSRALFVLYKLSDKYPDIRNELASVICDQLDKNTKDFKKRALKILEQLQNYR